MRTQILLAACSFSTFWSSLAAPSALLQRRDATSCTADPLTADTWKLLDIDSWLAAWSAVNVTVTPTNNVQSLAASFGSPNFFCGLDASGCNAGQPCLPVTLPAWYVMVAIQNWNTYMNAMNTALNFASTMVTLTLPSIVRDLYPDPVDNVTPLKDIGKIFTTALSLVPFTGGFKTAGGAITGGLNFVNAVIKPPTLPNLFLDWSNIATSLATVLEDYQGAISSAITTTLNAPVNSSTGIHSLLVDGGFLGIAQNFSQSDIQSALIKSTNVLAISLALQAQKIFVGVYNYAADAECHWDWWGYSYWCIDHGQGSITEYFLYQDNGHGWPNLLRDLGYKLAWTYDINQVQYLIRPYECWKANGGKQLADPFNGSIPLDPYAPCLFNLLVCQATDPWIGIIEDCRNQGVPV